jgi:large subunit ribosomal protein L4
MKIAVKNVRGENVGELDVASEVFGAEVNEGLLYEIVKAQLASRRSGSAKTKNRAEVAGSTKKIYKQKGTGNARHGSINAPIFVGGGTVHGPQPRSYAYRPTRKMRQGALVSAISLRAQEGALTVLQDFALDAVKTKSVVGALQALQVESGSLIVDAQNSVLQKSARNLASHKFVTPDGINTYDILRFPNLVLTKAAVQAIEARCKSEKASG